MSRAVLLDTDVFSFLFKRDSRATLYAADLDAARTCLSFQSVGELRRWALIRNWGERRRSILEESISRCLVLPFDDQMAHHWAEVNVHRRNLGRPIECGDGWIAATALHHAIPLLSHNAKDFADIPKLQIVSH